MSSPLRTLVSAGTALATLATLGLAVQAASAGGRPHGGDRPHGPPSLAEAVIHHAEELDIDEATVARVEALESEMRTRIAPLRESLRTAHRELRTLMEADVIDEAAVISKIESAGTVETALKVERMKTNIAVRKLLTAEQLQALRDLAPERGERMRGWGGRDGKRWQGPESDEGVAVPRGPRSSRSSGT